MITLHADEHRAGRRRPPLVAGACASSPTCKVALSEGGIGWIPYFLERIDYVYQHHHAWTGPGLRRPAPEPGVPRAHHHLLHRRRRRAREPRPPRHRQHHAGSATTRTPTPPGRTSPEMVDEVTSTACPTTTIDKITHLNAMRHFQLRPVRRTRAKEQCTVGALRAQAVGHDVSIHARAKEGRAGSRPHQGGRPVPVDPASRRDPEPLPRWICASSEQEQLVDAFAGLYTKHSTPEHVRAAEALGFDPELWERLGELGAVPMAVDESDGGWGASFLELALVAEQQGRFVAPVPAIETQ